MGRRRADLTGQRFTRLVVIKPDKMLNRNQTSLCVCECGQMKVVRNLNLLNGNTQSCGCLAKERASARVQRQSPRFKHGQSSSITYTSWSGMFGRCYDPRNIAYSQYGGRGIKVCERWADPKTGYQNFLADMGERPSIRFSLDRIDGNGDYEPTNCRWTTRDRQNQNVGKKKSNTTGYKGITPMLLAKGEVWRAEIRSSGAKYHLGLYDTKEQAGLAYNVASERLHGVFGVQNELPEISEEIRVSVTFRVNQKLDSKGV